MNRYIPTLVALGLCWTLAACGGVPGGSSGTGGTTESGTVTPADASTAEEPKPEEKPEETPEVASQRLTLIDQPFAAFRASHQSRRAKLSGLVTEAQQLGDSVREKVSFETTMFHRSATWLQEADGFLTADAAELAAIKRKRDQPVPGVPGQADEHVVIHFSELLVRNGDPTGEPRVHVQGEDPSWNYDVPYDLGAYVILGEEGAALKDTMLAEIESTRAFMAESQKKLLAFAEGVQDPKLQAEFLALAETYIPETIFSSLDQFRSNVDAVSFPPVKNLQADLARLLADSVRPLP